MENPSINNEELKDHVVIKMEENIRNLLGQCMKEELLADALVMNTFINKFRDIVQYHMKQVSQIQTNRVLTVLGGLCVQNGGQYRIKEASIRKLPKYFGIKAYVDKKNGDAVYVFEEQEAPKKDSKEESENESRNDTK